MIMPSYSTLPESMLAPSQVYEKFNTRSLAGLRGLGCTNEITLDDGSTICLDAGGGNSGGELMDCAETGGAQPCYTPSSSGGYFPSSGGSPYSTGGSGGLTPAQQAALDAQILNGGFSIAKLLAVQPGTTLSANGAISQQNPGFPNQTLGTSVGTTGLGSSAIVIAVIVAGAFLMSQQRGR